MTWCVVPLTVKDYCAANVNQVMVQLNNYANSLKCEKCHDKYIGWLWPLYLLLELIPLTIFFFLIVLFNIVLHCHHSPRSFVFFCQLFSELFKGSVYFQISVDSYSNNIFSRIVFTLVNIWNLDFFRYAIPPFCVSREVSDLHVVMLQYVSVFYPLLLVVITYIGIELHARNFSGSLETMSKGFCSFEEIKIIYNCSICNIHFSSSQWISSL